MARTWREALGMCVVLTIGCGGGGGTDAGSPGPDASEARDGGSEMALSLDGLDGEVEVIVDDRGMPHIYATTIHDLALVQGYLMSRDRFAQMEILRRLVTGRLAVALAGADPGQLDSDRDQRFLGFLRQGRAIYGSLPSDDPSRQVVEAFCDGINQYIAAEILTDSYAPKPGLELLNILVAASDFGRWEPADIFALARFQAWSLSYDAGADIARSQLLAGAQVAFPESTSPPDEVVTSRAGFYADLASEIQARRVYTRDGFNDGSTSAFLPGIRLPADASPSGSLPATAHASLAQLRGAQAFFDRVAEHPLLRGADHIGSNSWVVAGSQTATGNPILSNDPHLSLVSPGVWWYVHLNTAAMGGEGNIDAQGVAFAALPGVVLGYNRDIAWSATTTGYDVTDVYAEQVTFRNDGTAEAPEWVPVSVRFRDADVAVEPIVEPIEIIGRPTEDYIVWNVPHHGPLIPDSFELPEVANPAPGLTSEGGALSVRYTGEEVSNELAFFVELLSATSIDDALQAQDNFRVGSQNFSFATRSGDIAWSTESRVPVRGADACTFAVDGQGRISGLSPLYVLPGDGSLDVEWGEDLASRFIPHDVNPERGWIATANQDNVGVTDDGNPCNDAHYIGGGFAVGYRQGRVVERLEALTSRDEGITVDEMIELQAETRSSLGEGLRDPILASLDHALGDPSDDAALEAAVSEIGSEGSASLTDVRARLAEWSLATPHGVGATDAGEIDDSVATTLFNVMVTRLNQLAFGDEAARVGGAAGRGAGWRPSSSQTARLLEWCMADAEAQRGLPLYTYRDSYLGETAWQDSVLWDDVSTPGVVESRDERVVRAVIEAVAWLETELGDDWSQWRWGRLHAVRFAQVVPALSGPALAAIPPVSEEEFPLGFPRSGDYGAVDVGNFSLWSGTRFTHGSGASQRLVVEMTPDGPRPHNALPGGQSEDIRSPHHRDEAELWRRNEQPPLYFERPDVEAHAEETLRFTPSP